MNTGASGCEPQVPHGRGLRTSEPTTSARESHASLKLGGGRWGVAHACNCRPILDAIASLIEAQRPDLAMNLIEQELNSQT